MIECPNFSSPLPPSRPPFCACCWLVGWHNPSSTHAFLFRWLLWNAVAQCLFVWRCWFLLRLRLGSLLNGRLTVVGGENDDLKPMDDMEVGCTHVFPAVRHNLPCISASFRCCLPLLLRVYFAQDQADRPTQTNPLVFSLSFFLLNSNATPPLLDRELRRNDTWYMFCKLRVILTLVL